MQNSGVLDDFPFSYRKAFGQNRPNILVNRDLDSNRHFTVNIHHVSSIVIINNGYINYNRVTFFELNILIGYNSVFKYVALIKIFCGGVTLTT